MTRCYAGRGPRRENLEGYCLEGKLVKLAFLKTGFSCRESLARAVAYEKTRQASQERCWGLVCDGHSLRSRHLWGGARSLGYR
jgi:hypothetical protein